MTPYYFDSSALAKHFVAETGSTFVTSLLEAQDGDSGRNPLTTASIGLVEVAAAISTRYRMGKLDEGARRKAYAHLLRFASQRLTLLSLPDVEMRRAADLTQKHPLRGFDAVHLATALSYHRRLLAAHLPGVTFVCADQKLLNAARAEGLAGE